MGTIHAVCTSDRKGIQKTPQASVELKEDWGIEGDAHAGKWHRQVSLLGFEAIEDFKDRGADVSDGAFGENLIVEGFDSSTCRSARDSPPRAASSSSSPRSARNATRTAPSTIPWASASCPTRACSCA